MPESGHIRLGVVGVGNVLLRQDNTCFVDSVPNRSDGRIDHKTHIREKDETQRNKHASAALSAGNTDGLLWR
jgi:hypothetical protein